MDALKSVPGRVPGAAARRSDAEPPRQVQLRLARPLPMRCSPPCANSRPIRPAASCCSRPTATISAPAPISTRFWPPAPSRESLRAFLSAGHAALNALEASRLPVVGAIQGSLPGRRAGDCNGVRRGVRCGLRALRRPARTERPYPRLGRHPAPAASRRVAAGAASDVQRRPAGTRGSQGLGSGEFRRRGQRLLLEQAMAPCADPGNPEP